MPPNPSYRRHGDTGAAPCYAAAMHANDDDDGPTHIEVGLTRDLPMDVLAAIASAQPAPECHGSNVVSLKRRRALKNR